MQQCKQNSSKPTERRRQLLKLQKCKDNKNIKYNNCCMVILHGWRTADPHLKFNDPSDVPKFLAFLVCNINLE